MQLTNNNNSNKLEATILGAIINCKGAITKVLGDLNPIYFTNVFTQTICKTLLDMHSEGLDIDLVTVGEVLPAMASVTGLDKENMYFRLSNLCMQVSSDAHIETHMEQLKERYVKAELASTLMSSMQEIQEQTSIKVIAELQDATVKLLEHKATAFTLDHNDFIKQITENSLNKDNVVNFTGVTELDEMMQGTTENEFVCVAGIPGSGKSSLINTSLKKLIEEEVGFYFWSGEMTILQTKARLIAALSGVPAWKIEKKFTELDKGRQEQVLHFSKRLDILEKKGDIIFREGRMSVNQFQGEVLQARFKNSNIKFAFADAMRLFTEVQEAKDEEQEMGKVCRSLRLFCNTRKMRVVMVAQLVKAGRNSGDYVPKVSHIRGKGTDQEFTKIILVHRPYLSNMDNQEISQEQTQLIIGKNNHGATGVVEANFNYNNMVFEGLVGQQLYQEVMEADVSKFQSTTPTFDVPEDNNQIEVPF
jgi:replicative DNA helicase